MKVSEITTTHLATYLKIDSPDAGILAEIQVLLDVAKTFIRSYTGIQEESITGEKVGTGDGLETEFSLANTNIIPGTQDLYLDGVKKTITTHYTINDITGKVIFLTAPANAAAVTADYDLGLDAYTDFIIAVYILVQDMYDNRTLNMEKGNINKVVESILGMHSTNLL